MSVVVCFSFLGIGNFNFGLKDKYYLNQEFGFTFPGGAKMETNNFPFISENQKLKQYDLIDEHYYLFDYQRSSGIIIC